MGLFSERLGLIDTENAFKIGPFIREVEAEGHRVIRCNLGEPDFPLPVHVRDEVKRQLDLDNTHYTDPQGILPLRKAIARQIAETRGIPMDADRVVVFPGAKPPIGFAQEAYVNPGDEVIYPSPGFPIYESFTRYVGAVPVPIPLREELGFALLADDLAARLSSRTKLVILNFPGNPAGGVATPELNAELAEVLRRKAPADCRIYSDEVYEHILYEGRKHHSIASQPGMAERTIVVSGVSKSYSWTGGRVGWAAFPTVEEAQAFRNLNINYFSCMPGYNQEGARVAIESPDSAASIRRMVESFQERRDILVRALNRIPHVSCRMPGGAFYAFPNVAEVCRELGVMEAFAGLPADVRGRTSPSTLLQMFLLYRYQVATMDRKSFGGIGADPQHYLRISFATAMDDLKEALSRMARAFADREGFLDFLNHGRRLA